MSLPDNGAAVNQAVRPEASWEAWRGFYDDRQASLRPAGYTAKGARDKLLRLVPDARMFCVDYVPGRKDKTGRVAELVRPMGWETTTPGGIEVDEWRWTGRNAALPGWVQGDEWETGGCGRCFVGGDGGYHSGWVGGGGGADCAVTQRGLSRHFFG